MLIACPNGQDACPTGYCLSLYDVYSNRFDNGYTLETCKAKCEEDTNCFVFEFDFPAGNCGTNQRGWSTDADVLRSEQLDPGKNGDAPWYSGGVLQSVGQPSHTTCYPGDCLSHRAFHGGSKMNIIGLHK